jgi:hypothetical protein
MSDRFVKDLRQAIESRTALLIVGSGVSIAVSGNAKAASWNGLLEDGARYCVDVAQPLQAGWLSRQLETLQKGDCDERRAVAEIISSKLGAPKGGEFGRWLRESVGSLEVKKPGLIEALAGLKVPIATTNYDHLIEKVTGLSAVTWRQSAKVERVLRGAEPAVVHLHGDYEQPESVVLGIRSYDQVLGDEHLQTMLRALRSLRTLIFVGCGDGLSDPNFGTFLQWTRSVFAESEYRHYRLAREDQIEEFGPRHHRDERIIVLSFGSKNEDLEPYLRSLAPPIKPTPAEYVRSRRLPDLNSCFGRDELVEDVVIAILNQMSPKPTPILGGPGVGTSTIALAALHHPEVERRFGERRYFVRCDGAKSRCELVAEIAREIDIPPALDLETCLLEELRREPVGLVLDNVETPWYAETLATEDLLGTLGSIPGVALVPRPR